MGAKRAAHCKSYHKNLHSAAKIVEKDNQTLQNAAVFVFLFAKSFLFFNKYFLFYADRDAFHSRHFLFCFWKKSKLSFKEGCKNMLGVESSGTQGIHSIGDRRHSHYLF
jgi:hypothetical protein